MKFWKCNIVLGALAFFGVLQAQEVSLELLKTVPLKAKIVEVDNIGNIYTISENEISKFDSKGNFLLKNSTMAMGYIYSLDASNALKTMLFFKDLSQIVYLDNQLSERGERLSLDRMGYVQTVAVCRSYDVGMWLYDQTTFELTRLTDQLEITANSGNLAQVLGFVPEPIYMLEFTNWLYVLDKNKGILVFDWYGSYTKTIPVFGIKKFAIRSEMLFFIRDGYLESFDLKMAQWSKVKLPEFTIVDFSVFNNRLILITENELRLYGLNVE